MEQEKKEQADLIPESPPEHYEIWISLEKWEGDSKIDDVETVKLGNVDDKDGARQLFEMAQDLCFAVKPHIDSNVKVYD